MVNDKWEYPYWVLLKSKNKDTRIQHVNVKNITRQTENKKHLPEFSPCMIIAYYKKQDMPEKILIIKDEKYFFSWQNGPIAIYSKQK